MGVNNASITPKAAAQINQANKAQAAQSRNQANSNQQSARSAALAASNANTNVRGNAPATAISVGGLAAPITGPVGGTTTPVSLGSIRAQAPTTNAMSQQAMAVANAFSPAFMAATGAVAVVSNRRKASEVSGDAKEGEGSVELETEAEAQPDALQESDQEQGAGEITEAGSTSGPST